MKNAFLYRLVEELLQEPEKIENTSIILPGKRPEVFIKQIFKEKEYEGFLPTFYSIIEFAQQIAKLTPISGIPLLADAYKVFSTIDPNVTFESFLKWAPTVLKDFDEISIYTEHPKKILNYMVDIERIQNWGIESFESTELLEKNKNFWEKLQPFYFQLQTKLEESGLATSGYLLKRASENAKDFIHLHKEERFVFAGFNALSRVELSLFQTFALSENTSFLWDVDEYYLNNDIQEAGAFFRKYQEQFLEFKVDNYVENNFTSNKSFSSIAASKQVIQAKYIHEVWNDLSTEEIQNSAIVLCDENALGSVIESIPENIKDVNITMGYPILRNGISLFFQKLFQLHKKAQERKLIYSGDLLNLLHSFVMISTKEKNIVSQFETQLIQSKKIYLEANDIIGLKDLSLFPLLDIEENTSDLVLKCVDYCEQQTKMYSNSRLQKSIFEKLAEVFREIHTTCQKITINLEVLPAIFIQLMKNTKLDFVGEPLSGLQVMGLLETRLLNFENIILLNVNEGVLPLGRTENSFIPFDVKRKFGIDTFLENDSIYAYHFLRLLQRAKKADMLYDTSTENIKVGEKSRFLLQLEYELPEIIEEQSLKLESDVSEYQEIMEFPKTESVQKRIEEWYQKFISPSALVSYLYDPMQFFKSKILKLNEVNNFEDRFSSLSTGLIIHEALEQLYTPFVAKDGKIGLECNSENLKRLLPEVPTYVENAIKKENFPLEWFKSGINLIDRKISERMVENLIKADIKDCESGNILEIIELESKDFTIQHQHPELGELTFYGIIDRIDKRNGILRVIDYKTGSVDKMSVYDKKGNKIPFTDKDSYKLQLIIYAQMVFHHTDVQQMQCGLYGLKNLKEGVKYLHFGESTYFDKKQSDDAFEMIDELISEIVNPDIPFVQREKKFNKY